MIGRAVLHYTIESRLGSGGMGDVYLATDTLLDRKVALKFIPPALSQDPASRERLLREAKAASRLNHPNILTIYAVERDGDRDFIVMEYVDGQPLGALLVGRTIPLSLQLDVAIQIAEGLAKAHASGIIHRDIKPSNILVDGDARPRILDFGLARSKGTPRLTQPGSTVGTASYMSPEQAQGFDLDARTDIFSLGIVLYEMITGHLPFTGEHDAAIAYAIVHDEPDPLSRYKANIPIELEQVVARALAKPVDERYQTAADMAADLRRVRSAISSGRSSGPLHAQTTTRRRRRRQAAVAAAALLVVAAVGLFAWDPFGLELVRGQKAAAASPSLAVMYFDNLADSADSDRTAQMMTSLMITGLSNSPGLTVVSRQRLYDLLQLAGRDGVEEIDQRTASEIARRAGVRWILTGEVIQPPPSLVVTTQVVNVQTGDILSTQRLAADTGEALFTSIDRLCLGILADLRNAGIESRAPTTSVAAVTTSSPEAYRYYVEGVDLFTRLYHSEAVEALRRAVAIDTSFAMAYYMLARCTMSGEPEALRRQWIAKAVAHADRATWREQRYINALHASLNSDHVREEAELMALLERHPEERDALFMLGTCAFGRNDLPEAAGFYERVTAVDSYDRLALNMLAYTYDAAGEFEKSIAAINRYVEIAPDEANPYDTRGDLYGFNGRLDDALASYREALTRKPTFASARKTGYVYMFKREFERADSVFQELAASADRWNRAEGRSGLALNLLYQGRFKEAMVRLDQVIAADRLERQFSEMHLTNLRAKMQLLRDAGDRDGALGLAKEMAWSMPDNDPVARRASALTRVALCSEAGLWAQADSALADLAGLKSGQGEDFKISHSFALALRAYHARQYDTAIAHAERALTPQPSFRVGLLIAEAHFKAGRLDKAATAYERLINRFDEYRAMEPVAAVKMYYALGVTYEQSGWRDKAIEQYRTFLDIWRHADRDIPELADARARLARLSV